METEVINEYEEALSTEEQNESPLLKQLDERSEEIKDVFEKTPSWLLTWATSIITIILLILVFLTSIIKYPDVINAEITITSNNPPLRLYSKSEGKIARLFTKDEEFVKTDDVLVLLDNTANFQHVMFVKELLNTFDINNLENFNLVDTLLLGELQDDYNRFFSSFKQYKFFLDHQPYQNEIKNYKVLLNKYKELGKSNSKTIDIESKRTSILEKDLERNIQLYSQKLISAVELENKEKEALEAENKLEASLLGFKTTEAKISEIELNIEKLEIKGIESNNIYRNALYSDFYNLKSLIKDWELRYVIKSPINGKVTLNRYWKNFQNVKKGEEVISVVPDETGQIIGKVVMPLLNSGKVKKGNKAFIYLKNFPYQEFGSINAIVEKISLIPNGESYSIQLSLPNQLVTNYRKKLTFNQEMKGNVEIITEDLSLLQRIFYSFNMLFKYNN